MDKIANTFTSYSNIAGSAGDAYELISSAGREIKSIQAFDTTGSYLGIYVGPAGSEVLELQIGPGSNESTPCSIPTGSRVSIRALEASAPTAGSIALNFIG